MYSTKYLNKNVKYEAPHRIEDNRYLCLAAPFVDTAQHLPGRWRGKQIATPRFLDDLSKATFPYHGAEPRRELVYLDEQPPHKRCLKGMRQGFYSSDAHRSAEFFDHYRREAYRTRVRKELAVQAGRAGRAEPPRAERAPVRTQHFVYDFGRTKTTPYMPQLKRDTCYVPRARTAPPTRRDECRAPPLESARIGVGAWEPARPEHGRYGTLTKYRERVFGLA